MLQRAIWLAAVIAVITPCFVSGGRVNVESPVVIERPPRRAALPPDLALRYRTTAATAAADTTVLAWFTFEGPTGGGDEEGWVGVDRTGQEGIFFHVGEGGGQLNGGSFGRLVAIDGVKSMWCGLPADADGDFCNWAALAGYGNLWEQWLCTGTLAGDSVEVAYKVRWDSEPGYDQTRFQYSGDGGDSWNDFPVGKGRTTADGVYDGFGTLVETFAVGGLNSIMLRFVFQSDGGVSDEDSYAGFDSDGAVLVDSITVEWFANGTSAGSAFSDFESNIEGDLSDGFWTGKIPPSFGEFADIYPASQVLQDDPCFVERSTIWGFFDDPLSTNYACHVPDPRPDQGAVRFGPDDDGDFFDNNIWSPLIENVGTGSQYLLRFRYYPDLPVDNLVYFGWRMRSWSGGCATPWRTEGSGVFFDATREWLDFGANVSTTVSPIAQHHQISIHVVDGCAAWCGVLGTGACHSHGPLIDDVRLLRVDLVGPQFSVRQVDLFQDNFPDDGTVTGVTRADAAIDIASSMSPTIRPGDSVAVTITAVGTEPQVGGPSAYVYLATWNGAGTDYGAAAIEAPETRVGIGKRFPVVDSLLHNGTTWYCFRMDNAVVGGGTIIADRYCFDLRDNVFVPGDTICYFFCADDGLGNRNYWSRRLAGQGTGFTTATITEALASPCEFMVLPGGGWLRGGDILYVDDTDGLDGPVQVFWDTAFEMMNLLGLVDRYDVLGPVSQVSNGLAGRVGDVGNQLIANYRNIIWSSGELSEGTISDGSGLDKSDDYALLFQFLELHPSQPGLYINGDNIASEWVTFVTNGANDLRTKYMNFNVVTNDHNSIAEPTSPRLIGVGPCVAGEQLFAYGGCPVINSFDVLSSTGFSSNELRNPNSGAIYGLTQETENPMISTARVVLEGFSLHHMSDVDPLPTGVPIRAVHVQNILEWLVNLVGLPTGIDASVRFENRLDFAYPNPFNPTTTIRYEIAEKTLVSLRVYNAAGQLVRVLVDEVQAPVATGRAVVWDGRSDAGNPVSSGVYFYRLSAGAFVDTHKMVLLK